ncbi:hypothetical protein [Nonomuraea jabiensis]|uniref:hypothetical protein n=1 Tax=Nonomuraea jabiensis TaxID=882448 RepID=UPI003D71BD36
MSSSRSADGEGINLLQRAFDVDRSDTISFSNYINVLADEEEIDEVCLQAIEAGNVDAMVELSDRLYERDYERDAVLKAIPYMRRAAEAGHAKAQEILAEFLKEIS